MEGSPQILGVACQHVTNNYTNTVVPATAPSAVKKWSLVRVWSHIGVQNVQEILYGGDKWRSHKTSQSHNRGSLIAGTTVDDLSEA